MVDSFDTRITCGDPLAVPACPGKEHVRLT